MTQIIQSVISYIVVDVGQQSHKMHNPASRYFQISGTSQIGLL
jgi:hypothetical protein